MTIPNSKLNARGDHRLAAYAALAGAILATPSIPTADATIIWSGAVNINIPSTTSGIYLNVVTGVASSNPALAVGWDINPWSSSALNFFTPTPNPGGGTMAGTGNTYYNLELGFVVGPSSSFSNTGTVTINDNTPLNFNSSQNIFGFRFINEAMGGQIQYGWVQVALSDTAAGQPRSIIGYAYEDNGGPISGMVPEPATTSLVLMAAGSVGIRAWRKRENSRRRQPMV